MHSLQKVGTAVAALVAIVCATAARAGGADQFPLSTTEGLTPHNVTIRPATLAGKKGIRVAAAREIIAGTRPEELVVLDGTDFGDGVIEVEIAGDIQPDADDTARGFVGIAFRLQDDLKTYDAFYLRPRNGRDPNQLRRNHSTQYISHPDWPWARLRKEFPGVYESYVDLEMGVWTRVRIEVEGQEARLFVHGASQPTLVVHDLKSGASARGSVALWIDTGTIAHFRDLRIRFSDAAGPAARSTAR
jgi:hypothetical protein